MIRDTALWRQWEDDFRRARPIDVAANMRLATALYREARALGKLPPSGDLSRLEHKIRLARILNVRIAAGADRPRT